MDRNDYEYHYHHLEELDPDQLVCELDLSTEEILAAFPVRVREFLEKHYG